MLMSSLHADAVSRLPSCQVSQGGASGCLSGAGASAREIWDDGAGARDHAADGDEAVDVCWVQVPDYLALLQVERLHLHGHTQHIDTIHDKQAIALQQIIRSCNLTPQQASKARLQGKKAKA
jgi:hypothetical protein